MASDKDLAGVVRCRTLDEEFDVGARQEFGDGALADDLTAVHDRDGVARALHFVKEVRGQHDGAALGDEGTNHLAHVVHATRVEAVHRFVQDQELRIAEQARRDAEALAHTHGVLGHFVVGATGHADTFERRTDPLARRGFARGGEDPEILAAGEVRVETRLVNDRPDVREGDVSMPRDVQHRGATSCPRRRASVREAPE